MGETETYRVRAHNTAAASENRIHDDAVARRLGFGGGLVPGVDVYAYMTHPVAERWGRPWLERGAMEARFVAPVYDGELAEVTATFAGGAPRAELALRNPAGQLCARGRASLPSGAEPPPPPGAYPEAPLPRVRPRASPQSLAPGTVLGSFEATFRASGAPTYLREIGETLPLYRQHGIAHPGHLLRAANYALAANVELGPWIHVASRVRHFGVVADGDRVSTRARVRAEYENKGHRFVELEVLLVVVPDRPVMQVLHTAIYEPRQLRG